jgi:hypothetical protein
LCLFGWVGGFCDIFDAVRDVENADAIINHLSILIVDFMELRLNGVEGGFTDREP